MLFHSFQYFALFAITFAVFWFLSSQKLRLIAVLVASFIFYMSWNPWFLLLILFSTSVDYFVALRIERNDNKRRRRVLLVLSIVVNLGILIVFKYADFAFQTAGSLAHVLGIDVHVPELHLILPLGISFYTFEAISYVVDVYRKRNKAERDPLRYLVYIMFFPHLIAGPIVRPHHFLPQLRQKRRLDFDRLQLGAQIFLMGLFKKAVIADNLAGIVDPVFKSPGAYGTGATWLAVVGYACQIYCDFSGYSDMAVGSAHWLGFKLPENFNMPYFAANPSEFWARWHISLSTWLRDYLYIPLGGNRGGKVATCRNLMITMLLGGLWHGANWTFVAWGAYHGLLLVIHRVARWLRPDSEGMFKPLGILLTFLAVLVGWVFFRAQTFADAGVILRHMTIPTDGLDLATLDGRIVLAMIGLVFLGHLIGSTLSIQKFLSRVPAPALGAALACLLFLCQLLMPGDVKAFIYFQF